MTIKEYLQHLTDDEVESIKRQSYTLQKPKPENITLVDATEPEWDHESKHWAQGSPTYAIKCPCCGETDANQIWPRHVRKNNDTKLEHALGSKGNSIWIGLCCETCQTDYDLEIYKSEGIRIRLHQTGYRK